MAVTSGQTVLLAGLISETQTKLAIGHSGARPAARCGRRLHPKPQGHQRTELIIFIRPQIIRDGVDASVVAEELRSKMRGGKIGSTNPPGAVVPRAPSLVR